MTSFSRRLFPALLATLCGACGKESDSSPAGDAGGETPCSCGDLPTKIRVTKIDKLDLLIVVDDSPSMAALQIELGRRVPLLVKELTSPDPDPTTGVPRHGFADVHVGVITGSLGSYGTSACDPVNPHSNDHAHLLPRPGESLPSAGWVQPTDTSVPVAAVCPSAIAEASTLSWTADAGVSGDLQTSASCVVESTGADGCAFQNQLEAMYHFLVDPDPWQDAKVDCTFGTGGDSCGTNKIVVTGIDADLLAQRAAFLRPDSLLSIVLVTNQNDASLKPAQLDWIPWAYATGQMQRGWKACTTVPDDFEPDTADDYDKLHTTYDCKSCFEDVSDPNCTVPWPTGGPNLDVDQRRLRPFKETQRFGYNFLWGRQRYVDGLTNNLVPGIDPTTGAVVAKANPIFQGKVRTRDLVMLQAIVGVPLDLVTNASTGGAKALTDSDWAKILSPDLTQRDPRMVESIAPRAARPKYKGGGDLSADSPNAPTFGNGGDRDVADGGDLQYACIAPRVDTTPTSDCTSAADLSGNPLCTAGHKQPYFKAYPSLRELRVVHDVGASGFVASVCNDTWAPAMQGIIDKTDAQVINTQCFKSIVVPDGAHHVDCLVEESFRADTVAGKARCEDVGHGYCTPGSAPCRVAGGDRPPVDAPSAAAGLTLGITVVLSDGTATTQRCPAYAQNGNVYVGGSDDPLGATDGCGSIKHLVCEDQQLDADPGCLNDRSYSPTDVGGWCYTTNLDVVGPTCIKMGSPGTIHYVGDAQPKNGSEVFTLCRDPSCGGGGAGGCP